MALLPELQDGGYDGGISQFKMLLVPYKRHEAEPVVRFETPPGKQMQADFTSHPSWPRAAAGADRDARIQHELHRRRGCRDVVRVSARSIVYFGGTPEQVLFDNAKSVIVERDAFGEGQPRWNTQLLAVAETYGFTPKVCRTGQNLRQLILSIPFGYFACFGLIKRFSSLKLKQHHRKKARAAWAATHTTR